MRQPLVSIIVLSYKNLDYIYEALNSALSQDYSAIELMVTDDGSVDFNKKEIENYILKNKKSNIKKITVRKNKKNLGTVKSLNKAIKSVKGEYIVAFAADDAFYDKKVVSQFMRAFNKLPNDSYIVTSQLAMYDIKLQKLIQLFVNKKNIELLEKKNAKKLFNQMSTGCVVAAAGTCYKKEIFKKYGYFDEKYRLVEDWSSALRFSRLGVIFHYANFISFKHRDGGISHGNVNGSQNLNKQYDLDILNIMKREILPYLDLLDERQREKARAFYKDNEWRFNYNYNFKNSNKEQRRAFIIKNLKLIHYSLGRDLGEYLKDQLVGKKLKVLLFGLLLLLLDQTSPNHVLRIFGYFLILESLLLALYQIYKLTWLRIVELIKFVF